MRIGLLELVGGAVDHELSELLDVRPRLEEAGKWRAFIAALELEEPIADPGRIDVGLGRQRCIEGT